MKTAYRYADLPKNYTSLVAILPPRPIRDEDHYDQVQEMIDALVGFELNEDQADYLDAITVFFSAYEQEHYPIETDDLDGDDLADPDEDAAVR